MKIIKFSWIYNFRFNFRAFSVLRGSKTNISLASQTAQLSRRHASFPVSLMHAESAHKGGLIFDFAKVDALRRTHSLKYTHIQGHFPLFFSNCPIHLANVPLLSALSHIKGRLSNFSCHSAHLCVEERVSSASREKWNSRLLLSAAWRRRSPLLAIKGSRSAPKYWGNTPLMQTR